jgi:hypothetical protein
MRVLTSAVLVMEAIVLGLAIPVALVAGGQPASVGWLLGALALVALLLPGFARRPFYVPAGWVLQGAVIACGVFTAYLFALGAIFAALWWAALHFGRKAEAIRAQQAPPA